MSRPVLRLFEPCADGYHIGCAGFAWDAERGGLAAECTCECHGPRCPDCGEPGALKGHMGCQYPEI